ncbi:FAD-linked oxidoreductase-like protein [Helicostylum pulchrum]|nr:FAD-linked oxidoreductase-like protein [Helicostylum pulchrum]
MHRFVRPVSCLPLRTPLLKVIARPQTCRAYTTSAVKPRMPFKTIAASVALTSATWYYLSAPIAQAEGSSTPTTFNLSSASNTVADLKNFGSRIAVESKSTAELAMALFVYRLCALPWLVDAAPYLIAFAEKIHMETPVYWFVKQTFFRHFCGGETSEECISSMNKLAESNIGCILDLSVEADLHVEQDQEHVDGQGKYHRDEQQADAILGLILNCIRTAAGGIKSGSMAAVKVTAFSPPELLLRLNQVITALDQTFLENQHNGNINAEGIRHVVEKIIPAAESEEQMQQRESIIAHLESKKATLDVIEFRKLFNLQGPGRDVWWKTTSQDNHAVLLTAEDLAAYDRMMSRLEQVSQLAYDMKVGIMVDAEQSYFQDAIDHVAINLQRKFNHRVEGDARSPTIYNTYQMYTKSSRGRLELDVELANRENFTFAAKLVRGAYMVSERKRAEEMGYVSPIHETLEDTHESYNGGVKFLLNKLGQYQEATGESVTSATSPIVFMVASHNRDSVIRTIEEMDRNNVMARAGVVHFGQLFGMQDQLSYTLGRNGYSIYKYLPYGMIDEVIPYLLRRAQENSSVLGGAAVERQLMWEEFKGRLTGKANVSITEPTSV